MTGCPLTPPAPGDLACLLNQWEAWEGMVKRESAGGLCRCLDCREGALVLHWTTAGLPSEHRQAAPTRRGWSKLGDANQYPDWLGDATPAVRRAYEREAAHGRQ